MDNFSQLNNQIGEATDSWTIDAITQLVNFAAITLEPAQPNDFPRYIIDFFSKSMFDYPFVGFLKFDDARFTWDILAKKGKTNIEIDGIPTFEGNMILEEEKEVYTFFNILSESFLIIFSYEDSDKEFGQSEYSFFSLFSTLVSSFYHMKKLAKDVEEKMVEMNTIRTSSRIINELKENSITIEEAFNEMMSALSIEGIVLSLVEKASGEMRITFSRGIQVDSWDQFLELVYTMEEHFNEEWELFSLFDENMITHGAVGCLLSRKNPTLYAIQKRVLDYTIPQITTFLSQKKFHTEAITDALTNIFNRRHVMKILKDKMRSAKLDHSNRLSIGMVDIDHFKPVNDTYGHQAGDEVLKVVVDVIGAKLRETDIVGRYGGEEFIVILVADKKGAKLAMEKIRKAIEKKVIKTENHKIKVTISVGISNYDPDSFITIDKLIEDADKNLYKAKETGRNKVVS